MQMKHILLTPIVAILLAACGGEKATNAPAANNNAAATSAATTQSNVLKVAIEPVYPPYIQPNANSSDFLGYDIDVLNAIAEREGLTLSFSPYPWNGLFDRLNTGEADIVAGGLSAMDERKENMDFTESYDESTLVLAVPKDSTIQSFSANELRGKNVFYQKNSAEAAYLQQLLKHELDPKSSTDSAWLSIKAVMNHANSKADAAVGQDSAFEYYNNQYKEGGVKLIYLENQPSEKIAFAVKKGNTDLLNKLNSGLAKLKADGTLEKIHDKWSQHELKRHASILNSDAASTASAAK